MIIDLPRFIAGERPYWAELEAVLDRLENEPWSGMNLDGVRRFHYLYQRTSADLARMMTFSAEPESRRYLESLVARAYAEIHETRGRRRALRLRETVLRGFPRAVRRHAGALALAVAVTIAGAAFGGFAMTYDPDARAVLIPEEFGHLHRDPAERVKEEESATRDRLEGGKAAFSTALMTHNTRVSILLLALGMTGGVGTVILLFYNGVILGAVAADYLLAGQSKFLLGWLLPHGAVEIPAFLIAGQAGLLVAGALVGRGGERLPLGARFRAISGDLVTLIAGAAALLAWAGLVEAFLSQYHEPVIPYALKIGFGGLELVLLALFLVRGGTGAGTGEAG